MKFLFLLAFLMLVPAASPGADSSSQMISSMEKVEIRPCVRKNHHLCTGDVSSEDVAGWLSQKYYGWYAAAGREGWNGEGIITEETGRTLIMSDMAGSGGLCAGVIGHTANIWGFADMVFRFSLKPEGPPACCTWSLWYDNRKEGKPVLLKKETRDSLSDVWNVSCVIEKERIREIRREGIPLLYIVFGSTGGTRESKVAISDISLQLRKDVLEVPFVYQWAVLLVLLCILMFFYGKYRRGLFPGDPR